MQTGLSKPHYLPGVQTEVILCFFSQYYFIKYGGVIFKLPPYSGMRSSPLMPFLKASWMASRPVKGW